jgi:hypothetical protein
MEPKVTRWFENGEMKTVLCTSCEICGELVKQERYEEHFKICSEKKEKAEREHKRHLDQVEYRKNRATNWASKNDEVLLLCAHGKLPAAKTLCYEWASHNCWCEGTKEGWDTLLSDMLDAAMSACGPIPGGERNEIRELDFIENVEPKTIASKMLDLGWEKIRVEDTWTDICKWGEAIMDSYQALKESRESGE